MALSSISSSTLLSSPDPCSLPISRLSFHHVPRSSFLFSGRHSSGSTSFVRDGIERLGFSSKLESPKRQSRLAVQALFGLGVPELVVIAGVAALIFGPKQLPEIGKNIGKTVKSFQQAAKEFEVAVKQGGDSLSEDTVKSDVPAATTPADTEKENSQV